MAKQGLYANIHAKRERIERQKAAGKTPERMRSPGDNKLSRATMRDSV